MNHLFEIVEHLNATGFRPQNTDAPPNAQWYVAFFTHTLEYGVPVVMGVPDWCREHTARVIKAAGEIA